MSARRLEFVEIKNIKAIKEFRCEIGAVTVISGANGTGKTTILDAIAAVFEGGHDPELIRNGATKGEIVLGISDGVRIRKAITPKGSTLTVQTADGGMVRAPKRYVEKLAAGFAFDPLAFIEATPKDQLKFLLEALPIEFDREELQKALGSRAPMESIGLERLNEIRLGLYSERQDLNRQCRDLEGTIRSLEETLPEDADEDWSAKVAELQAQISERREALASAKSDLESQKERLKSEKSREIGAKIQALRDELSAEDRRIDEEANRVYSEGVAETQAELETLTADHATAKQRAEELQRVEGARRSIKTLQEKLKGLDPERIGAAIDRIDKLKTAKLSTLPIDGVDIRDGKIYVNDVHWPHVNTSEQYVVAVQLASLKAGELGLMVCDKAEHLNPDRFEEFKAALTQTGLTVIAARAEDGELRVESVTAENAKS